MDVGLLAVGVGKIVLALALAGTCVGMAVVVPRKLLNWGPLAVSLQEGNTAIAVVDGAALLGLALLCRQPMESAFETLDLLAYGRAVAAEQVAFVGYLALHVGITLAVGLASLVTAILLFDRATAGVDEVAQIRDGNLAPAVVLAAVLLAVAYLLAPGLASVLDAFMPWPEVGGAVSPPT